MLVLLVGVILSFISQLDMNLKSPMKREPLLIDTGEVQLTVGLAVPRLMVLSCRNKQAGKYRRSKPVSSVPPSSLLQFLTAGCCFDGPWSLIDPFSPSCF